MHTFVLIAMLYTSSSPVAQTYVIDQGLTGEDCIQMLVSSPTTGYDEGGHVMDISNAELACVDLKQLQGPAIGSPEWAVEQAAELNRTGKNRDRWTYYACHHSAERKWFIVRRLKGAPFAVAVFTDGEVVGTEL